MRITIFLAACMFLAACGQNGGSSADSAASQFDHKFAVNKEKPKKTLPKPLGSEAGLTNRAVRGAQYLKALAPVVGFVKLEASERSIIGEIEDLARLQDYWLIRDGMKGRIFQFREDGSFVRVVGAKGSGPGEYEAPEGMAPCWGDHVCVSDAGRVLVYNLNGFFVESFAIEDGGSRILVNNNFIWDEPERLYVGAFPSNNPYSPWHAFIRYQDREFKVAAGFGERFGPMETASDRYRIPAWRYDGFARVGDRIWTGSPYSAILEIYDLEGRLAGRLRRSKADQLIQDDFKEINMSKQQEVFELFFKPRNYTIIPVGNLVFAYGVAKDGLWLDIFDANGNLINGNMKNLRPYNEIKGAYGNRIVSVMPVLESLEKYNARLTPNEMKLLGQAGFDPEDYYNDNPYLVIGELAEQRP